MRQIILVIAVSLFIISALAYPSFAYGTAKTTKYNMIEVILSESCQRMINNNITSSCPHLKQLIPFDTSNQMVSGKFINNTSGEVIRTHPQFKNNWLYYQLYNHNVVCVQCNFPFASPDLAHIIIIEPRGMKWINKLQGVGSNHTVTIFQDRYVSPDCNQATLGYDYDLLADTISYINSGCTKTFFNNTHTMNTPTFPVDRENTIQYKYQKCIGIIKKDHNNTLCMSLVFKNPNW